MAARPEDARPFTGMDAFSSKRKKQLSNWCASLLSPVPSRDAPRQPSPASPRSSSSHYPLAFYYLSGLLDSLLPFPPPRRRSPSSPRLRPQQHLLLLPAPLLRRRASTAREGTSWPAPPPASPASPPASASTEPTSRCSGCKRMQTSSTRQPHPPKICLDQPPQSTSRGIGKGLDGKSFKIYNPSSTCTSTPNVTV
ncbi:proline-rich receptor-like protein kinase PERK9 [Triticum aestivum]|uniref:proline-rich receptor-like protein kinase PERK9 n=1 Tax=Triticum aestivum TaxID=4565 RepID=UPI001D017E1D|nr:proline-rich receptor-like protein kinase PERK9 [Triticum aestivum]